VSPIQTETTSQARVPRVLSHLPFTRRCTACLPCGRPCRRRLRSMRGSPQRPPRRNRLHGDGIDALRIPWCRVATVIFLVLVLEICTNSFEGAEHAPADDGVSGTSSASSAAVGAGDTKSTTCSVIRMNSAFRVSMRGGVSGTVSSPCTVTRWVPE
jgi:hypothetical protein